MHGKRERRGLRRSLVCWAAASLLVPAATHGVDVLVAPGATWSYNASGTDLGTAWREAAYDESAWPAGPAELGYGDGGEATLLPSSPVRPCYYFRHRFNVANPSAYESLTLKIVRDDGCVVYINGVEVVRSNMPAGTISYGTWASSAVAGSDESAWFEFSLGSGAVTAGENVLAVEIHQSSSASTDISFNLELDAIPPPPSIPQVTLVAPANGGVVNTTSVTFTCSATDPVGLYDAALYVGTDPSIITVTGPANTDDAQISATAPATRYGTAATANIDGQTPHAHAVIKFPNLLGTGPGQLPPGSTINSAVLEVYCTDVGNAVEIRRLIEDWVEGQVTWNERYAGTAWRSPGADGYSSAAPTPVLTGDFSATGWRSIDVREFVQNWSDGSDNFGLVLSDTGTNGLDFDTSESARPPRLTVTYQPTWVLIETAYITGTSATVTFQPVPLEDQKTHAWNCWVRNMEGQGSWAPASFNVTVDTAYPNAPTLVAPADGSSGAGLSPALTIHVSDPQGGALMVEFYGRTAAPPGDFTLIGISDTQIYTETYPQIYSAQTQWIADSAASRAIAFVTHAGDIVNVYNDTVQWARADASMALLEGGTGGFLVPYGVSPGNHDLPTTFYNQYFGPDQFQGQAWYGEGYPAGTNDSNFALISANGIDFLVLQLRYCPTSDIIAWADGVLEAYPDRIAIITTHGFLDASGNRNVHDCGSTQYIWDQLVVPNDNVYFVLCGHVSGEYTRTDLVNGRQVHQMLADYQGLANGGDGRLRILRFAPAEDKVYVQTYSPWLDQYDVDANSQFTLDLPMRGFDLLGTVSVASGQDASVTWTNLELTTQYEWFARVTDGSGHTQTGPIWRFTTGAGNQAPVANPDAAATDEDAWIEIGVLANDTDPEGDLLSIDSVTQPAHGTATITGATITYAPAASFSGSDSFTYVATDGMSPSGPATVTVTVANVHNDAPAATDDYGTTDEEIPATLLVLANDTDPDPGDTLTVTAVTTPAHGTAAIASGGTAVVYTPDQDFSAVDGFDYTVTDGGELKSTAHVTVTVNPANDPPVANPESVSTDEDVAVGITLSGSDIDGDPLTFSVVGAPAHGTLSGSAPNVKYTPNADYNGPDSFTFTASDGTATSAPATVAISVTAVNDPPVAQAQSVTTAEDTSLGITLAGTDPENDPLTFSIVPGPAHGTFDGLTYTPAANYNGPDSFTFTASDGTATSAPATVTITVTPVNDPPIAQAQSVTTAEDTALGITLAGTDPENDPLAFSIVAGPAHGTFDGLNYAPAANYNGPDSFTFTANDGNLTSAPATVTITVTPVNDPPVVQAQSVTAFEDTATAIMLAGSDPENDPLTFSIFAGPAHGTLSGAAPNLTYIPAGNYAGPDSFTFTASDGTATSTQATVTIAVIGLNDPPVAQAQSVTTAEDTAIVIELTGYDIDGDVVTFSVATGPANGTLTGTAPSLTYTPAGNYYGSDSFTFTAYDGTATSAPATVAITVTPVNDAPVADAQDVTTGEDTEIAIILTGSDIDGDSLTFLVVSRPAHGTLSGAAPNLTYAPAENYHGSDSFTFTASDGALTSAPATVEITVSAVNDAPDAVDDTATAEEETPTVIAVLTNDTDPDGDTLTVSGVTQGVSGAVTTDGSTVTYTPTGGYNGTDEFTYTVSDGAGGIDTATVTVTVTPANDPPTATGDSYPATEDTALVVPAPGVLGNDADSDGDPLSAVLVTPAVNGTLTLNADGSFTYVPAPDFSGTDSFTYSASDGKETSAPATVTITVTAVNDVPVAAAQECSVVEDGSQAITLTGSDADGDPLAFSVETGPAHGTLSGKAPNVTYTPNADYYGSDSFTFTASDGTATSAPRTVTITVTPVNDPPIAQAQSVTTAEDTALGVTLAGTDPENDPLAFSIVAGPAHGTFDGLNYAPAANYNGSDSFTFTANDGNLTSAPATVTITVTPVNDPPTANSQSVTTAEDTAINIVLTGSDAEGDLLTFSVETGPAHGSLSGAAPNVTYTPAGNYYGSDGFTFTASDGTATPASATVTITVTPVNDPPIAQAQSVTTAEDTALGVTLAGTDPENDPLAFSIVAGPAHGTFDGLNYAPAANYNGPDSFTFTASDGTATSAPATVTITVTPVNDPPVAAAQECSVVEDGSQAITLTGSDADGDPLTFSVETGPAHGSLSGAAPNVTYTPAGNYYGSDSFTFTASDGTATSALATVTITVTAVNDVPVAAPDTTSTPEDTPVTIAVLANDSDADGDALVVSAVGQGAHGTVANNGSSVTYSPSADFFGTDSFSYTASDGKGGTATATVNVTVNAVNDPPAAVDDTATTPEGTPVSIPVLANDVDPEGQPLSVSGVTNGSNGTTSTNGSTVTYTPNPGFSGADSFTYTANDGNGGSDTAVVSVTVTPGIREVHVESITMSVTPVSKNWKATARTLVHDQASVTKQGATVTGDWYLRGQRIQTGATGTTGADGTVALTSPAKKASSGDVFQFRVTSVTLAGYTYNASAGVTQGSIAVP